jgi:hypothetical protein
MPCVAGNRISLRSRSPSDTFAEIGTSSVLFSPCAKRDASSFVFRSYRKSVERSASSRFVVARMMRCSRRSRFSSPMSACDVSRICTSSRSPSVIRLNPRKSSAYSSVPVTSRCTSRSPFSTVRIAVASLAAFFETSRAVRMARRIAPNMQTETTPTIHWMSCATSPAAARAPIRSRRR